MGVWDKMIEELREKGKEDERKDHGVKEEGRGGHQAQWVFIHELGQSN